MKAARRSLRLLAAVAALSLGGTPGLLAADTVALVVPRTGPEAWLGAELADGATLAADALPGDLPPVRLVIRDDGGSTIRLREALLELAADPRTAVIVGAGSFGQGRTVAANAHRLGIPVIVCGDPVPTGLPPSVAFPLLPSNRLQIQAMLAHAASRPAPGRLVALFSPSPDPDLGKDLDAAASAIGLEGRIVVAPRGRVGTSDLDELRRSAPRALLLVGDNPFVAAVGVQLRLAGLTTPLYGRLRQASADFAALAGDRLTPFFAVAAAGRPGQPPVEPDFARRFRQRFGRSPSSWAALGHDGIVLAARATQAAGGDPRLVGPALTRLGTHYGVGFAVAPSAPDAWLPAVAELRQGSFVVVVPPGATLAAPGASSPSSSRSAPSPSSSSSPSPDAVQTGVATSWTHFLPLPGR